MLTDGVGRLGVGPDYVTVMLYHLMVLGARLDSVAVMYQQMAVVAGCRTALCSCHVV